MSGVGRAGGRARESVALRSHAFRSVMAASDSDTLRLSSFCMRSGGNVHFVLVAHGDRGKEQGRHREERVQGAAGGLGRWQKTAGMGVGCGKTEGSAHCAKCSSAKAREFSFSFFPAAHCSVSLFLSRGPLFLRGPSAPRRKQATGHTLSGRFAGTPNADCERSRTFPFRCTTMIH